jgi:hypothetical protein
MANITTLFLTYPALAEDSTAEESLSPRVKALVITGLALAAWVLVLVPVLLFFHR